MGLKYKIYVHNGLLVDVLTDNINLNSLIKLHRTYKSDEKILSVKKVLTNVFGATFNLTLNEMLNYIEEIKSEALPTHFKWAILTDKANATMFSMLIKDDPFFRNKVEVFCTFEASLRYLNINYTEDQFFEKGYIEVNN